MHSLYRSTNISRKYQNYDEQYNKSQHDHLPVLTEFEPISFAIQTSYSQPCDVEWYEHNKQALPRRKGYRTSLL